MGEGVLQPVAESASVVMARIPVPVGLRGYDAKAVSLGTSAVNDGESFVQQQFQEEVDINTIVRRFGMTRSMPLGTAAGVYGDFTGIEDYDSAVAMINRADEAFMRLDPEVRERFANNPGELLRYAQQMPLDEFSRMIEGTPAAPVVVPPPAAPAVPVVPPPAA